MKERILRITTAALGMLLLTAWAGAQGIKVSEPQPGLLKDSVSLDQKLNEQVPLEAEFKDETGKPVKLGDYFGQKPVILVMPFYRCVGSCAMELDGMVDCFRKMNFNIGDEFNVLAVSIHPQETPDLGLAKQKDLVGIYNKKGDRPNAEKGWHFLTGDWDNINKLAAAVGFRYVYDEKKSQIAHPAGIMVITPQGKMSRYFYGVNYAPKSVRLALIEASENKIGTVVDKVTLYCSAFDMSTGKYNPSIYKLLKISCIGTVLILGTFITVLSFQNRRVALKKPLPGVPSGASAPPHSESPTSA